MSRSSGSGRTTVLEGAVVCLALLCAYPPALSQSPVPAPTQPCPAKAEYRQLDFWLGEWSVLDRGKEIARSTIRKMTGGCVILETYVQPDGYTGRSINFFDPTLRKWRQTWVDSAANVSEFVGEYRETAMRFEGESHRSGGETVLRRMTLFDLGNGDVRQFSERSVDGGGSWSTGYDFLYVKRP
jgi:hypothetical protein